VATADVNPGSTSHLGPRLSWAVVAFTRSQSAHVVAWGMHPIATKQGASKAQEGAAVYHALNELRIKVQGFGADSLFYDSRGWSTRGIAIKYGIVPNRTTSVSAIPAEGWSARHYRPTHKTAIRRFEGGHEAVDVVDGARVRWVAWHTDIWHESSLGGWTCPPGSPGACSIHAGSHRVFAEQVANEVLAWKKDMPEVGMRWEWKTRPGDHDFADVMSMAYMAAAFAGIGTGGQVARRKRYVEKRRCKVERDVL